MARKEILTVDFLAGGDGDGLQTVTHSEGDGTPTAAWVEVLGATADGSSRTNARRSMGAYDGTRQVCVGGYIEHGAATSEAKTTYDSAKLGGLRDMAGGWQDYVEATGFVSGGIALEWNGGSAAAVAWRCRVHLVFGTSKVYADIHDTALVAEDAAAQKVYASPMDVAPEWLWTATGYDLGTGTADLADWNLGLGFGHDNGSGYDQSSYGLSLEDGDAGGADSGAIVRSDAAVSMGAYSGTPTYLELTDMSKGASFGQHSVTKRDGAAQVKYIFLAVSFEGAVGAKVDTWTFDVTTTGDRTYSAPWSVGFAYGVMQNITNANTNNLGALGQTWGTSAFDWTANSGSALAVRHQNNSDPTSSACLYTSQFVYLDGHNGSSAAYAATLKNQDGSNFVATVADTSGNSKPMPLFLLEQQPHALEGTATGSGSSSGTVETDRGNLAGTVAGEASLSGVLENDRGGLAGSATGSASVSGDLSSDRGSLAGSASGSASASGDLGAGRGNVSGGATGSASVSGELESARGSLSGALAGDASASGTLIDASTDAISGTLTGSASASGTLASARGNCSGSAGGTASASGTLTDQSAGAISGTAAGSSTVSGTLGTQRGSIGGRTIGSARAAGTLTDGTPQGLSGEAMGDAAVSGALTSRQPLAGTASGTASAFGTLTDFGAAGAAAGTARGSASAFGLLRNATPVPAEARERFFASGFTVEELYGTGLSADELFGSGVVAEDVEVMARG